MATTGYSSERWELIERTRLRMEEWTRGERTDFVLDEDSENRAFYPIVRYINEYLDAATNEILAVVPTWRLHECAKDLDVDALEIRDGVGYVPCPEDFIKLEALKCRTWSRSVGNTDKQGTDSYTLQQNKHSRGIQDKPHVGLAFGNLEIYSMKDEDDLEFARYIYRHKAENTPRKLHDLITLQCAYTVEGVFGNTTAVQLLGTQLQTQIAALSA